MRRQPYCHTTGTPVAESRMRPGYDCRCAGCLAYVAEREAAAEQACVAFLAGEKEGEG